jgi:sigma-54 dependent transcriptional regulator, acetoin dehydrogenase operon transcriptional activator AcoR
MPSPVQPVASPGPPAVLVGASELVTRARQALAHAATLSHPVLLEAEPGCRVIEVAGALHAQTRADQPFVELRVDAPGEPAPMVRLFGTPAYPADADLDHLGGGAALCEAGGGTVFIDGLDDLPAAVQRRLSRVLRDGEVTMEGAPAPVALRCRLVAATTCHLPGGAPDGRVRGDLLRRFRHCVIAVPPLRQRPGDFAALLDHLAAELGHSGRRFTQAAVTVLSAVPWSRNVDELAETLAAILPAAGPLVRQEDVLARLPFENAFARFDTSTSLREARRRFERDYIAAVLERHHWRMSDAARTLGIERANLYRKARQLGITRTSRTEAS